MAQAHVENLEHFLKWLKTSENYFIVSSMSGGFVHVKFLVPIEAIAKVVPVDENPGGGANVSVAHK